MNIKLVLLLFIMTLPSASDCRAAKVKMGAGEWIPYTSTHMPGYGEFTELVSIVFKEMEMAPEYVFYPWRRCCDSVIKGLDNYDFPNS